MTLKRRLCWKNEVINRLWCPGDPIAMHCHDTTTIAPPSCILVYYNTKGIYIKWLNKFPGRGSRSHMSHQGHLSPSFFFYDSLLLHTERSDLFFLLNRRSSFFFSPFLSDLRISRLVSSATFFSCVCIMQFCYGEWGMRKKGYKFPNTNKTTCTMKMHHDMMTWLLRTTFSTGNKFSR